MWGEKISWNSFRVGNPGKVGGWGSDLVLRLPVIDAYSRITVYVQKSQSYCDFFFVLIKKPEDMNKARRL